VIANGTVAEQQSAIATLGTLRGERSQDALGLLLMRAEQGAIAPAVRLDVAEAALASGSDALRAGARKWLAPLSEEKPPAALGTSLREAMLAGGSVQRGREVVLAGQASQCTRCHTVETPGADVGPPLTHIGSQLPRETLLEALLAPSARLAPGYGIVTLALKDGKSVVGTLREETADALVVETAPGKRQRVAVKDVAKRTNLPSPMPVMGKILTPREIRDVVEYLSALR
jgi:putative heme-binding domain-containing protein